VRLSHAQKEERAETTATTARAKDGSEQCIEFSVWDFAGRELYNPIHAFFLSPRSCIYLVAFNMVGDTNCFKRTEYFLKTLRCCGAGQNPIVVLVGTHLDNKKCTSSFITKLRAEIEMRYERNFPFIRAVAFVSCRTGKYETTTTTKKKKQIRY